MNRREFITRLTVGAAALGVVPPGVEKARLLTCWRDTRGREFVKGCATERIEAGSICTFDEYGNVSLVQRDTKGPLGVALESYAKTDVMHLQIYGPVGGIKVNYPYQTGGSARYGMGAL
jgi:hypothetical protein